MTVPSCFHPLVPQDVLAAMLSQRFMLISAL